MVVITPQGIGRAPLSRPQDGAPLAPGEFLYDGDPTGLVLGDDERSLREPLTPLWAITPRGAGKRVSSRRVRQGWPLTSSETFVTDTDPEGMVLAEDEVSLRAPSNAESLAPLKRARQAYINTRRDAAIASGVEFAGNRFDTDKQSIDNLTAAVAFIEAALRLGMPVPVTVSWRTENNTDVDLTPDQLVQLGAVMFVHVQTQHMIARGLKDTIQTRQSPRTIDGVEWP